MTAISIQKALIDFKCGKKADLRRQVDRLRHLGYHGTYEAVNKLMPMTLPQFEEIMEELDNE